MERMTAEQFRAAYMPKNHSAAAKKRDCPLESEEQKTVFHWAILNEKKYPELALLIHVPNGGLRNACIGAQMRAEGVRRGFPDMMLPVSRKGYHAFAIELKRKHGGMVSPEQKEWLKALTAQGWLAIICRGAEWAGFHTVGQCEFADYPYRVLCKRWPDVPKWRDIRTLTGDSFYEQTGLRTVTVISGGFPCQPFSIAGKRRGAEDDRYLWPEMLRVIKELRPPWVLGENVAGFVSLGLDGALSDLEAADYETRAFIIPACAVGAPHRRDRVFIVSWDANCDNAPKVKEICERTLAKSSGSGNDVADIDGIRRCEGEHEIDTADGWFAPFSRSAECGEDGELGDAERCGWSWDPRRRPGPEPSDRCSRNRRCSQPGVGGASNGFPARMDFLGWPAGRGQQAQFPYEPPRTVAPRAAYLRSPRIKCIGNAVVPQQAAPIFAAIAEIEKGMVHNG